MRRKFKLPILFIFLICISNALSAITLNKMQVNSKQDEPLNAVIDVIYSKGDKASNLKPAIASKENYEANGLSRLPIHSDIQIRLEDGVDGGRIYLISKDIVKDPFLDLLIQIDSEKGRVYKEYTVLLEPPSPKTIIKEVIEAKNEKVEAVAKKDEVKSDLVQNSKQDTTEAEKSKVVKEVKKPTKKKEDKFKIVKSKKGKTLYQISRENKPSGVTTEQMVLAIYQNNPKAFSEENVNTLINNKKLKIPPVSYFKNHSHLEARKVLRGQNIEWKNKLKKINKPVKQKKIINKDAAKIDELKKELVEAKKKLEEITRLNIDSKNNSVIESNIPLKENVESLREEQSPKEQESSEAEVSQAQVEEVDDGVFVSSISDFDENKIDETEVDISENKGLETIHVLLLVLLFVLLLGLFFVTSRRKSSERNQTLKSFVDDDNSSSKSFNEVHDTDSSSNLSEKRAEGKDNYGEDIKDSGGTDLNKSEENKSESKKNYLPIADDD